jgi:hypothetical protein
MYSTKQITDNSLKDIQYLFKKSFGTIHSLDDLKRKYDTSAFGEKTLGIIAYANENNDPAAYYGVFPITLIYNGEDYLIAQSGDTMTSIDHRKKGLFVRLAKEAYDIANNNGVNIVYGFPNENSYPGFVKKLNWVFNGNMQRFSFKGCALPICEFTSKYRKFRPFYNSYFKKVISKYAIPNNVENAKKFEVASTNGYIKKDTVFFNYKLNNNNSYLINYHGFYLHIKLSDHLLIGTVGNFDKTKIDEFVKVINKLAKELLSKKAILTISHNHWLFDILSSRMDHTESLPIGFFEINKEIDYKEIEFTLSDYDTF